VLDGQGKLWVAGDVFDGSTSIDHPPAVDESGLVLIDSSQSHETSVIPGMRANNGQSRERLHAGASSEPTNYLQDESRKSHDTLLWPLLRQELYANQPIAIAK
jgi:hypothetical protein